MKTLWHLLSFVRPHGGWAVAATVAMIGVAITTVFSISLIAPIFDEVLGGGGQGLVAGQVSAAGVPARASKLPAIDLVRQLRSWFDGAKDRLRRYLPSDRTAIAVIILITIVVKNVLTYLGHYAFYRTGLATIKDLRDALVDAMLGQSARFYQEQPTAVLMSRVTADVEQITVFISDRFSDLFQDTFAVLGMLIYVFSLNFRLAFAALIVAPLLIWPVVHFARKLQRRSHQSQDRLAEMNTVLDEVLKGYRVVQAFGMQVFEARRFREATRLHFVANLKARKIQALNAPVMEILGAGGMVLLIVYASRLISTGQMKLGIFASFLFGLYSLYNPLKRLTKLNLALQMAVVAGQRCFTVLDAPVTVHDRPGARPLTGVRHGIRFEHVSFAYEPEKPVLRDFSLEIPAGCVVALVGASGAGKSTVAQLLPRFWDVGSGRITVDGLDVRDLELRSLRAYLGLVTQETVLFNTTIRANIAYGQEEVDEQHLRACARAAFAEEFILEFPHGYETVVGESGLRLSGGQRQRLAVARALYKNPPILILDEATSALDAEAERIVQRALENLMQGRTTLVIAHRLATVRNADAIAVVEGGRVVERGTHTELMAAAGIYARLAALQGITE